MTSVISPFHRWEQNDTFLLFQTPYNYQYLCKDDDVVIILTSRQMYLVIVREGVQQWLLGIPLQIALVMHQLTLGLITRLINN